MEGGGKMSSDDDDDLANGGPSLISIVATLSKLKRKVVANRDAEVTEKMRSNSVKLRKYTDGLFALANHGGGESLSAEDKLIPFHTQKVLCNFSSIDAGNDGKDDGLSVAPPIIFGSSSGGRTAVRPTKLPVQPNVPPYTSWIYLERNQRMTEDQSVQGRRRIYYDPVGNETLIASDSEEEEPEEEEPKHDFSKGEDFIIWTAVQERGASGLLFEQISQSIHVKPEEVQARYELLLKDVDKQAKCEAHGAGSRMKVSSPGGRRKGTRDLGRLTYKDTKSGAREYKFTSANGTTRKLEDEKVEAKDLVAAMDSFDNLFCRRCLVFDCRLHGCSQPLVHPSERQPSTNTDSEASLPCGPHCYSLAQPAAAESEAPILCLPGVADSKKPGDFVPRAEEGADTARFAKRQKDGEISWGGEKRGSANAHFDRTTARLSPNASSSPFGNHVKLLIHSDDDEDIAPGRPAEMPLLQCSDDRFPSRIAEMPLLLCSTDGSPPSLKREPFSVASRLTSHKKLARSTTRRSIEENGTGGGELQHLQKEVIDLTGEDLDLDMENGNGSSKRFGAEMTGKTVDCATGSEQRHNIKHGEEAIQQQERTRFISTKKLARSAKRALEENMHSPVKSTYQGDVDSEIQDGPMLKKQARTTENGSEGKFAGAVSTPPRAAEGAKMDVWTGSYSFKEKDKVTSPKKLARSARKPNAGRLLGTIEGQKPLTIGKSLVPSPEAEKPVKDENVRNSAARKLARSARKVFAEKVAVAIQQQQLHSQIDVVSKGRGEREDVKEERFDTDMMTPVPQVPAVCNALVPVVREEKSQEKSQSRSANADGTRAVDSNQYTDRNKLVLVDNNRKGRKRDLSPAGPTKVVTLVKATASKSEDAHNHGAEFKDDWTPLEKGLYEKGQQIFGKSSCMIAKTMLKGCKTCAEVREYIIAQDAAAKRGLEGGLHQFPDSLACVLKWDVARARARFYGRRKGSRKLKFTLKSAGNAIRKRLANGKDAPQRQYTPCGCLFTCGKQCPCQLSGTCCEKYCGCAKSCKNRFRGCHCAKSQCCSRQCPCFAAGRECDPDVCRNCWIGCGDGKVAGPPHREDKDNYQCHNMKLLLKQQQRVLLGRSDVAGWGAFLKNTVSKHEYLGEYTGELISHREADKRGKIYDRENSSFLFNLNDQYVLDACRKGDKLKFANHSPNPNCYAKVIMVAGDHRVGIFANERIMAGEELFYDYRYEAERAPSWARRGENSGGNGKKDDSGPSERRSKQAS